MKWRVEDGPCDDHIVEFAEGQFWGFENILPRDAHASLFAALKRGDAKWRNFTITMIDERKA